MAAAAAVSELSEVDVGASVVDVDMLTVDVELLGAETTFIVNVLVSVARFERTDLEVAVRVMLIEDGAADPGTSPDSMRLLESNASHGVWGDIDTETSTAEGLTKAELTLCENVSPIVAFNGEISPGTKMLFEIVI
jgi:hypothetical protein